MKQTKNKYTVDASAKNLGRLATEIALILMGKNVPDYTPNIDCAHKVEVLNIKDLKMSGESKKLTQKKYHHYSGYPGGLKTRLLRDVLVAKGPQQVLIEAVKKMLPKNKLQILRLKRISFKK